ncbi:DUF4254 domain-containing protein [Nocardia sp. NPDC057227]|uniref:DUF4254 domain-containing protein n=1 Tax=Nocardia sp. NPDC057227 TaxID=3346056 RepID=UPI0036418022
MFRSSRPATGTPLSGEAMLSAIRGHHVGNHRLAQLAYEFGQVHHRALSGRECECHDRRDRLIREVDTWARQHLPIPHPDAVLHTETLGTVIDRIAQAQVRAYHLLMTVDDVAAPQVHAAWYRLAQLVDDYRDLITAVEQRSLRVPTPGHYRARSAGPKT